jgi:hypothetical protein
MGVEDHPKWKAWSDAYDALQVAAEDLKGHKDLLASDAVNRGPLARYRAALTLYNKVADELETGSP